MRRRALLVHLLRVLLVKGRWRRGRMALRRRRRVLPLILMLLLRVRWRWAVGVRWAGLGGLRVRGFRRRLVRSFVTVVSGGRAFEASGWSDRSGAESKVIS